MAIRLIRLFGFSVLQRFQSKLQKKFLELKKSFGKMCKLFLDHGTMKATSHVTNPDFHRSCMRFTSFMRQLSDRVISAFEDTSIN